LDSSGGFGASSPQIWLTTTAGTNYYLHLFVFKWILYGLDSIVYS